MLLDDVDMPIRFDRRAGTSLRRQSRLDTMFSKHADHRIPDSVVKIVRGAAVEIGDSSLIAR